MPLLYRNFRGFPMGQVLAELTFSEIRSLKDATKTTDDAESRESRMQIHP
jgi:hypothetical protein